MHNPPQCFLCNPEPDPLQHIPGVPFRPLHRIQRSLTRVDVRLGRVDPLCTFEDLPADVQQEEDGDVDILGDEVVRDELGREGIEPVEDEDDREENKCGPGNVWLERRLEDEGVAVNTLRLEGLVKHDVCDADGDPGAERGDGAEVLEPGEGLR